MILTGRVGSYRISWWTAGADIAVDSRMTFGPFDISENALTTLGFFEAYY